MQQKYIFALLLAIVLAAGAYYWLVIADDTMSDPIIPDSERIDGNTDYIGMTTADAQAQAAIDNAPFRIVEIDGQVQPTTRDFMVGRVSAVVADGIVTNYTVERAEEPVVVTPPIEPEPVVLEATNDEIIGMTVAQAQAYAEANEIDFRTGSIDGEPMAVTMDFRIGRITADIEDGLVVSYTVEAE